MFGRNAAEAPVRERGVLAPRSLLREGELPWVGLAASWADVVPGLGQRWHDGVERAYGFENAPAEPLGCVPAATWIRGAVVAYDTGRFGARDTEGERA